MVMMNTFGYNSNSTSFFHRNDDNDNSNHQSPSKKTPQKQFPLSKKSPSVHTHENSPCPASSHPLHSAPDEKKNPVPKATISTTASH